MTRPSKLWRTLGATQSLFLVDSPAHGSAFWYDDDVHEMSFTRGTTMRGLSTSGGRVTLRGKQPRLTTGTNQLIRARLTPYGMARLTALGVPITTEADARRFYGRVAGQTIHDHGEDRYETVVDVQDYASLLSQIGKGSAVEDSARSTSILLERLISRADIPAGPLTKWGSSWHHITGDAVGGWVLLSTEETITRLADAGVLVRTLKDGRIVAWSHDHIIEVADDWETYWPNTLLRAQVLSPVEWEQPPGITTQYDYTKINSAGQTVTGTVTIGSPGFAARTGHLDLTGLREVGTGLNDVIVARASEGGPGLPRVRKVVVDILALLRRGRATDLDTVTQLLQANHGEALVLAHDWPIEVVGVSFVQTMTGTITPDTWRIELDLVPANHVTGRPIPPVRGRTWDSAYPVATTWDATPNDPTWDEH